MGQDWSMCQSLGSLCGCLLDELGIDGANYCRKVVGRRKLVCAIRYLVIAKSLHLECVRVIYEALLEPILLYGSNKMVCREKEKSRIRTVQLDNIRDLLGIRRTDRVSNARIRKLCEGKKGMDERTNESFLRWLVHIEIKENNRSAKMVCVGDCMESCLLDIPRTRRNDSANNCLKKRDLDVGQTGRMAHDRHKW